MFNEARKLHGHVDIVCANAGINDREDVLRDDLEEPKWDVLEVNLKGVLKSNSFNEDIIDFSDQSRCLSFPKK